MEALTSKQRGITVYLLLIWVVGNLSQQTLPLNDKNVHNHNEHNIKMNKKPGISPINRPHIELILWCIFTVLLLVVMLVCL